MGELIQIRQRRAVPPATGHDRPAFFFDLSCPLSYLTAERVERALGAVRWVATDGAAVRGLPRGPRSTRALRCTAEARARALGLPLVWPDTLRDRAPRALRAAAFASEQGAGGAFALAASRLAFCGGFDLEDPETLVEAAAAAGVALEGCLAAAGQRWRDADLRACAEAVRAAGIHELPAIHAGGEWYAGEAGLAAGPARRDRRLVEPAGGHPMAPVA
ncbi:MAG: DsbA family protein [Solirubrobacteraceae bacterium]|jgi:2-hydroxychromene-2-carboxylate isomerase